MAAARAWDVVTGPGITALGLAASRTVESSTPDRLIEDPLGAAFVAAVRPPVAFPTRWPGEGEEVGDQQALHLHGSRYIGLRSRFYDDFLLDAARSGIRQLILLAAGLDTRAFRLAWPSGTTVFELDQPQVIEFKDEIINAEGAQPACRRIALGTDLREDWRKPLLAAGFDAQAPTAWVAEGLLAYLPPEAEERLFREIAELSRAGSRLAADRIVEVDRLGTHSAPLDELTRRSGIEMASLIDTQARADCADRLRAHGWTVREDDVTAIAQRYGRDLSDPFGRQAAPPWLDTGFVTAELASGS